MLWPIHRPPPFLPRKFTDVGVCDGVRWVAQVSFLEIKCLVCVVSTTGNGDQPDNSDRFWRFIRRRTQPTDLLTNLRFGLLALGDTNYNKFWCVAGCSTRAAGTTSPGSVCSQQRRQVH